MPRKLAVKTIKTIKIDGKEHLVELGDGEAQVGDLAVEVLEAEPGVWILRAGGEQTVVQVDGRGDKRTVEIRRPGSDLLVLAAEIADARRAPGPGAAPADGAPAAPLTIRSPIPGKLAKVLVAKGENVTAGQTLVVLEAMKMENELRAPRAGRVATVHAAEGATVEASQDLVTIV